MIYYVLTLLYILNLIAGLTLKNDKIFYAGLGALTLVLLFAFLFGGRAPKRGGVELTHFDLKRFQKKED